MKKLITGFLTLAGFFASAESSVWKVSKGASVLYVGATCHLLREADFSLPPEFDSKLAQTRENPSWQSRCTACSKKSSGVEAPLVTPSEQ